MTCELKCKVESGYFYCKDTGERCPMGLFDKPFGVAARREQLLKEARQKVFDDLFDFIDKHKGTEDFSLHQCVTAANAIAKSDADALRYYYTERNK